MLYRTLVQAEGHLKYVTIPETKSQVTWPVVLHQAPQLALGARPGTHHDTQQPSFAEDWFFFFRNLKDHAN